MKNFKRLLGIITISSLTIMSCIDEKKSDTLDTDNAETEVSLNSSKNSKTMTSDADSDTKSTTAYNNINKVISKDGNNVERSIDNEIKAMQISGWSGFNTLSKEMKKLEGANLATMKTTLPKFANTIASLKTTRPDWMKTEEIGEDIEDLQKEYKELMSKNNTNDRKYGRDLEELNEAYDDLVEEINETFDKYVKINRKANEEYMEEINDDGDIDDAREEYNEEIKKLEKVADEKK